MKKETNLNIRVSHQLKRRLQRMIIKLVRKGQEINESQYIRMSIDNQLKRDGVL